MSTHDLKPGDRVRVTLRCHPAGYSPGDKGTVLKAAHDLFTGNRFYVVTMDRDGLRCVTALMPQEIDGQGPAHLHDAHLHRR
jgi:hypothetical protein